MLYAIAYAAILVPFCILDAVWLTVMGKVLYKPTLGDILLPTVNLPPAVAFYLIYPIGILVFGVLPGLKAGSVTPAILYAALFGALAYATYDLTNLATLREWPVSLALIDMAWGTAVSAVCAGVGRWTLDRLG